MKYEDKVMYYLDDGVKRGFVRSKKKSLAFYRFARFLGIKPKPYYFLSFFEHFTWASLVGFFVDYFGSESPNIKVSVSIGLAIGLVIAVFSRWKARQWGLISWEDYPSKKTK